MALAFQPNCAIETVSHSVPVFFGKYMAVLGSGVVSFLQLPQDRSMSRSRFRFFIAFFFLRQALGSKV